MKNNKGLLLIVEYLGYITIGIVANMIGPSLIAIRNTFHLNYGQSGLILSAQFFGMLISVIFGGYVADQYGKKPYILAGGVFLTAGLAGAMLSGGYLPLLLFIITIGVGYGAYSVGINALCADHAGENPGKALSLLHLFFGVGAIISPLIVSWNQNIWHSWRPVFGIIGILPIIVSLLLLTLPLQRGEQHHSREGLSPYRSFFLWTMGLVAFTYVGIEVASYGWLPSLWKSLFKTGSISPLLTSTIFWLALTLGRIFSGKLADHLGLSRFLTIVSIGVLLMTAVWWGIAFTPWAIGTVFILGLFLAGIYPTIMAVVTVKFPGMTGEISAFISVFSSLGGFLIPSGIGRLADLFGITKLPILVGGLSLVLVIGTFSAWKLNK